MGLEIYIIENIKKVESDGEAVFTAFLNDSAWSYKMKNLEEDAKYKGNFNDAGFSYPHIDHNNFMMYLLKLINRNDLIDKDNKIKWEQIEKESYFPFKELIDFGDNESGCLDWEMNKKLYKEFIEHDSQAKKYENDGSNFYEIYKSWTEAFKIGKEKNSVVILW